MWNRIMWNNQPFFFSVLLLTKTNLCVNILQAIYKSGNIFYTDVTVVKHSKGNISDHIFRKALVVKQ